VSGARGPLLLLAGVVAGVASGERVGARPASVEVLGGLVLAAIVLVDVVARGASPDRLGLRRRRLRLAVGVTAMLLLGSASMQRALHGLEHSPLTDRVASYRSDVVWVTLDEDPGGPSRFVVDALGRVAGRTVVVVGRGDAAGRLRILSAGERVRLRGSFRPLSGWHTRQRWRHAVGTFEATDLLDGAAPSAPLARLAHRIRALVLAGTNLAPARERALLAGLLLGDTRSIPPATVEEFRASGLTHHLAVSGENVAFVLALAGPLLRRLGYRGRFVVGLAVIVVFGTMTRWEPSVLRAVTMAGIAMFAGFLGRPASGLRLLVLAATVVLLADPFLIHSVGFALSCGATVGIALLSGPISHRLRGPRALCDPLAITLAAQVGVAPVLIPVFGDLPLSSLPANVLAAPLMGPITIGGLLAGTLGGVARDHAPGVSTLLLAPVVVLVQALQGIAGATSRLPGRIDGPTALALVTVACVALAGGLVLRGLVCRSTGRLAPVQSRRARLPHP
jgi:competence protein ComEC